MLSDWLAACGISSVSRSRQGGNLMECGYSYRVDPSRCSRRWWTHTSFLRCGTRCRSPDEHMCLKSNGGAQRFPQAGWKSAVECIGTRELDCEAYTPSRDESRAK